MIEDLQKADAFVNSGDPAKAARILRQVRKQMRTMEIAAQRRFAGPVAALTRKLS